MKIAIIGTNGFLSTSIAKYAVEKGWPLDMYGLDKPIQHSYTHFYPIDLIHGDIEVDKLGKADIIVYAAGAGIQSNLNEGANLIYALNVNAPVRICNALKQASYKGVFVTLGSYFELGETILNHPATEDDIINANALAPTDYVVSKRMLTRFVSSYKHEFTHWHFILPTIYGVGENENRLIPYTIKSIIQGKALQFTSGKQIRQYLHVSEVPALLWIAYQKGLPSGIYNIQGPDVLSVKDVVTLIHEKMGKTIPNDCFGAISRDDIDMQYLCLDGELLHKALGYIPKLRLKDVIEEYIESYGK